MLLDTQRAPAANRTGTVAFLAAVLAACGAEPRREPDVTQQHTGNQLRYRLEAPTEVTPDDPVELRFVLENRGERELFVLRWNTPLEGLRGEALAVTRDGLALDYRGPLVKRGDPSASAYIRVAPGAGAENTVDLSRAWDFSAPGRYRVSFPGPVHDCVADAALVPRPRGSHVAAEVDGESIEIVVQ